MSHLEININALGDETPVFENATQENTEQAEITNFGILEKGTKDGDLSVSFLIKKADGSYVMAQLTGNIFRGAVAAFKGAEQRFLGFNK